MFLIFFTKKNSLCSQIWQNRKDSSKFAIIADALFQSVWNPSMEFKGFSLITVRGVYNTKYCWEITNSLKIKEMENVSMWH